MSDLRKAAQEALEALEYIAKDSFEPFGIPLPGEIDITMDALRAALAQPDTEMPKTLCGPNLEEVLNAAGFFKRKPLDGEKLEQMLEDYATHGDIVRAVEKAHGIE